MSRPRRALPSTETDGGRGVSSALGGRPNLSVLAIRLRPVLPWSTMARARTADHTRCDAYRIAHGVSSGFANRYEGMTCTGITVGV
ncbi:hypothetical protein GV794_25585 [Nocardia cyriacigeorgica]|uniref:Uncharacterized protein n=1 Tax=Nocardia cyriacigeorgica TaxID=135487 RepID=A0ABX0CWC9_9NOCA|nr:hypothetical protein [Nocardia cyriacigeorgica]NEW58986.1 hypothetical protein [Nocardia cyriacigeorgica]